MKLIPIYFSKKKLLSNWAFVEDGDFELVNQYTWHIDKDGYALCRKGTRPNQVIIRMHRLLLNTPLNMIGDHINGNRLDNRRANLRNVTRSQNNINVGVKSHSQSGIKGVRKVKNRWKAEIRSAGKAYYLGYYATAPEAAAAYNEAARRLFGEYARLSQSAA